LVEIEGLILVRRNKMTENKEMALEAIEIARNTGKIKKGVNEATKALERGIAKLVVYAQDVQPAEIVMHLSFLAEEKGIPCIQVNSKEELGNAAGIPVSTTAVVITNPGDSAKIIAQLNKTTKKEETKEDKKEETKKEETKKTEKETKEDKKEETKKEETKKTEKETKEDKKEPKKEKPQETNAEKETKEEPKKEKPQETNAEKETKETKEEPKKEGSEKKEKSEE
jgi:large subunit ribosomal protein L7Ae